MPASSCGGRTSRTSADPSKAIASTSDKVEWCRSVGFADGVAYRQGYLSTVKERTVRVRTIGDNGYLTIKGITVGATRTSRKS